MFLSKLENVNVDVNVEHILFTQNRVNNIMKQFNILV